MPDLLSINQTLRNLKRYAEILSVLARHGFGDIVVELKLDRFIERGMSLVGAGRMAPEFDHIPRQVRLRKAMEELGPTFIKLGQVLSTRPDLIPEEWADEFRNLQDNCPILDYEIIDKRLDEELGDERSKILKSVQHKALAAGSMAQVHRATLKDGTHIVLKVLRPGIEDLTQTDMEIMRALAEWAESHFVSLGYSPTEVVDEFARELAREVDLTQEARATEKLRAIFDDDDSVLFPAIHWQATTKRVLAQDEIVGIPLSSITDGQLTAEERRSVVANGARAVARQCLEVGFFHADPHPGNLFALPGGRVAFVDCGMTGQLDARTTEQLAGLVASVVGGDVERVIRIVGSLAEVEASVLESRAFRADVRTFVGHFDHVPLSSLNVGALLREFFQKLRQHNLRCPADLVLLIKAITTIESVGERLDPGFQIVEFAQPYVEKLVKRRYGPRAVRNRIRDSLINYADFVENLPGEIQGLLTQLRKNRIAVNIEHRGLQKLTNTIEHASRNISFAVVVAAMLVGSSILVLAGREPSQWALYTLGVIGFLVAFVLAIMIWISNRRLTDKND
jgi:ubiquinone biosynthesis protein